MNNRIEYFRGKKLMELVDNPAKASETLGQLTQMLEKDASTYKDFDIKAERLSMDKDGNIVVIPTGQSKNLLKKISTDGSRLFEPTRHAAQQLLHVFDIPKKYSGLLYDTDKELLSSNFNRRKTRVFKEDKKAAETYLFMRTVMEDNKFKLRAALSSQYTLMDNIELHYLLTEVANDIKAVPQSWHVDDGIFHVRYVVPEMCYTVKNGNKEDKFFMLYNAWNSEIGTSSVWLDAGSFRLVCTNGMMRKVSKEDEYRRVHKGGSNMLFRMDIKNYLEEQHKNMEQHRLMLQDSVKFTITDVAAELEKLQKKYELRDKDIKEAQKAFLIEPYNNVYGLVNAITRGAQAERNPEMKNEIESKAGIILFDLIS